MFRFAHYEYLNLLFLLPALLILLWFAARQADKLLGSFAGPKMRKVLFPERSRVKGWTKSIIVVIAIGLVILGLANPQVGSKVEEVKQTGIDVFILLDVSLSMKAEDIKPSRLDKAKHEISRMIQKLRGDRIGLIVFSGDAYIQFPLTTDYAAADLFLSAVDVSSVPQPGTAIGPAISLAIDSFKGEDDTQKAIVVITDGEDHEGDLEPVVNKAVEKGIEVYAIGLGSPSGTPIPVFDQYGNRTGYKKDRQGEVVLTKLDETTLKEITDIGNGEYYRATNTSDELDKIYNDLSRLEEAEYGATRITEFEDRFYWFIAPALLLLFVEIFISRKRSGLLGKLEKKITNK